MSHKETRIYQIGCTTVVPLDRWESAWKVYFAPDEGDEFSITLYTATVANVIVAMNACAALSRKYEEENITGELTVSAGFMRIVSHPYHVEIVLHGRHKLHLDRANFDETRNLINYMHTMAIQEIVEPDYDDSYFGDDDE